MVTAGIEPAKHWLTAFGKTGWCLTCYCKPLPDSARRFLRSPDSPLYNPAVIRLGGTQRRCYIYPYPNPMLPVRENQFRFTDALFHFSHVTVKLVEPTGIEIHNYSIFRPYMEVQRCNRYIQK